jgi:protein-S-isoprenylcysteine O-methyltransferase Ste14
MGCYMLFIAVAILYGNTCWWLPWRNYRRFGHTGVVLFQSKSWGDKLRDAVFIVQFLLLSGQALAVALWPTTLLRLMAVLPETMGRLHLLAMLLLFGGVLLVISAQYQMGVAWRLGTEEGARPGLVTGGLYRVCRNPISLGMLAILLGFTVLVPTWLSLGWLGVAMVGFRQQVYKEEAHLLRVYHEEYLDYARRVGRFVPGLGKLP